MSPEQTQSSDIDYRTDIWSLGVVLYEMLTGGRPFQGAVELAVIYNIVNVDHVSIDQHRSDVSPLLQQLISKALQKRPDDRHEDMNVFLEELEQAAQPAAAKKTPRTTDQDIPAIAVLPFSNMSADPEQEYFCDGMAEEIINRLMTLKGMRVTSRTSSFQFKEKQVDVREIGKTLGVDTVLEGSVRKAGNQLRITAQLINVSDGFHMWSQRYDRDLEDVFAIQDDIAKAIVTALRVQLAIEEEAPLVQRPTERVEAYDAYLKGLYLFNRRSESNNDKAIKVFEEATGLDPTFALAYAGIAFAYIERFFTYTPAKEWEDKAFAALERALELDPDLAEAHVAKGNLLWTKSRGFPHREAIDEYERAIELKPDLARAHVELARVFWHVGALNRAYAAFERALRIDPAFMNAHFRMGMMEIQRGNYEHGRSLLTMVPDQSLVEWAKAWLLMALLYLDRRDEARETVAALSEEEANNPSTVSTVSIFLAVEGREKEAEEKIQHALENGKDFGHFHHIANEVAVAYALMGKKELALKYIEEAASDGFPCYSWFERDPFLKSIQDEPRFIKMIDDMRKEWGDLETD